VAKEFKAGAESHDYGVDAIPADGMILDVGPLSVDRINAAIDDAHTLVWNGPLGAFEMEPYDQATVAAAKHAAKRTKAGKLVSVGAEACRGGGADDLCLGRRRRLPRMAGRQDPAGCGGAGGLIRPRTES